MPVAGGCGDPDKAAVAAALNAHNEKVSAAADKDGKKPNIVLLVSDDTDYGDLGPYGGGVGRGMPTPNIDRLANEGMQFYSFYAQPSCTPGRAAMLTGRIPNRSGMTTVAFQGQVLLHGERAVPRCGAGRQLQGGVQPAGQPTGGLAVDTNLGWKGPEKYTATVPQVFDLWQDPQERYDIFMNNYTERTWTLVTINEAIQNLMKTYVKYPPRKLQSEVYTGPLTMTQYEKFQHYREMLEKGGFKLPVPTGN